MVRVTKNGAKTLLDCARQGQSHVNYAKFLSFLFQTTVIEIFSPIYILLWADLNGYIREPSDSDTVELGESWIKFNVATIMGDGAKNGIENGSASFNDKCLLKST